MRLIRLLILFFLAIAIYGCGSSEQRAASYVESAQELFDEGDYINAKLDALNAAQIEPKNAQARYLLALIAEQDGRAREMLQHLLVAVDEAPDRVDVRVKLGTLYALGQVYDKAAEQAAVATELAPDDPNVLVLNARLLLQREDFEAGVAALDEALAADPGHVEAIGMKVLALQAKEPDRALTVLDEAVSRLARDLSEPLRRLKLDILEHHGRTEELEQSLLGMIEEAPDDGSIYQVRLAQIYANQGRMDEAEDMLRDLAAAASEDVGARLDVVQFLAKVRAPETAADALQAFIDEDPENQKLKLALGDLYLRMDRSDEALTIYREVEAIDSRSESGILARVKLAAERVRNGDTEGAIEEVSRILADDPSNSRALLLRAGLRFAEQRYDAAIVDLRILLRKDGDNQRALLLMARSHVAAGDMILGKDAYSRLLALNPENTVATRELIALMMQENDVDEVETVLAQLAQDASGNVAAGVLRVDFLVQQEDWPAAETEARRLAADVDVNGIGQFKLGQVLERQGRYVEATAAFMQALEKRPDNIPFIQGLVRSLNAQGKNDDALAYLQRRTAENPDHTGIRLMLGGALIERHQTAAALELFESVIVDRPGVSAAYVAIAALYPDNATKRIAAYRRGLDALPENLPLAGLLTNEYQLLGRFDEVIDLTETLYAAYPDDQTIANNLAAVLADHQYQDSRSLERAVQLADGLASTDDPLIMDTVGWVYYRNGDSDRAVRYLERSAAEAGEIPVIRYHLGMAYLAAGDRVGARQELKTAIQSAKSDFDGINEAREALATLEGG